MCSCSQGHAKYLGSTDSRFSLYLPGTRAKVRFKLFSVDISSAKPAATQEFYLLRKKLSIVSVHVNQILFCIFQQVNMGMIETVVNHLKVGT